MLGTPLSTEKKGTMPKINVVLGPWKLTYDEYDDPNGMHCTRPGSFTSLKAREGFFTRLTFETRRDLCSQEGVKKAERIQKIG